MVEYKFFLDGQEINAPVNWQGIQVLATFDQSSIQANISTEEFEFVNESAQIIRNYIEGGETLATNGIFEGLPFEIFVTDGVQNVNVFQGFLDFRTYEEITPVRVKCSAKKSNGLNQLDDRSRANSFGYLEEQGFIGQGDYTDIDYITEKLNIESDVAVVSLALFLLLLQIAKSVADLNKEFNTLGAISGTATPTAPVSATTGFTLNVAIEIGYLALLVVQTIKTLNDLVNLLIPPIRQHKGLLLRTMMEKASSYLGYTYESPLNELDNVYYLPSKPRNDEPLTSGIPNATDFGYSLGEAFELINKLTNSKIQIIDDRLVQRSLNDIFWIQNASYQLPDVLDERIKYNNADFSARTFINFATDNLDDWTIDNFTGTNYEIIVNPINGKGSPNNLMSGLGEVNVPMALASRKGDFNFLENTFLGLFQAIDFAFSPLVTLVNGFRRVFGIQDEVPPLNTAGIILRREGVLKVSQKNHSVAKLVVLGNTQNGLRIPENHRNTFKAKVLYDKYYNYNSFVANDFGGQRRIYLERERPFGFSDFQKCIENSYFTLADGRVGKVESIKWILNEDKAIMDYWVQEVYTTNLIEEYVEG